MKNYYMFYKNIFLYFYIFEKPILFIECAKNCSNCYFFLNKKLTFLYTPFTFSSYSM